MKNLKIEYDMQELYEAIKAGVKEELSEELSSEIKEELKSEMRAELKETMQETISTETQKFVINMMKDIYNNEKIVIGGGWDEERREYTLKEYVIMQIKDTIANNRCGTDGNRYSRDTFREWFTEKCVSEDIQRILDKEMRKIREDINFKIKNIFDDTTKTMLSDTMLKMLMANDTYKNIENNIKQIANR